MTRASTPAVRTSPTIHPSLGRVCNPASTLTCRLGPLPARLELLAFTLAAGLLLASGCSRNPNKAAPSSKMGKGGAGAPVPVLVTQVVVKPMPFEVTGFGNVEAFSKVSIRSRISGELKEVHFREGQDVKRGDLLFTIDPRPLQAALNQSEANLARDQAQAENARVDFERQKKLLTEALIARDEYDKAEANLKAFEAAVLADRAALSNAALNLEFTRICSPIEGRTGTLLVHPGNLVQSGVDTLVTLRQVRPIYVSFSVPEQHLGEIKQRMAEAKLAVEARMPSLTGPAPKGELCFIENEIDKSTGTIELKATFPNENGALWPGQFVQVALQLKGRANATVVPTQAIQSGQTNEFVFVVKTDQTVEMRPVRPAWTRDGETVVEGGLKAGETVVTDGQLRIVPGVSRVNIKPGLMPAAASGLQAEAPKSL